MSLPSTKRDFVSITGNVYTFYQGNARVASVIADWMNPEILEEYRSNHRHLLRDIQEPPPSVA